MSERAVQKVIRWRAKGLSLKLAQGQAVATTHRYLEAMIEPPQDPPIAFEREVDVPRIRWNPKKEPFGAHIDRFRKAVLRDQETLGKIFQWKGRVILCSDFRNLDFAYALVWWINHHTPETLAQLPPDFEVTYHATSKQGEQARKRLETTPVVAPLIPEKVTPKPAQKVVTKPAPKVAPEVKPPVVVKTAPVKVSVGLSRRSKTT